MKKGLITKLIGGLYTVVDENKESHLLKGRGKFRHMNVSPKVGDHVEFDEDFIQVIADRKNDLSRPAISNIDQAILINSAVEPDFSFNLLDRFLLIIEYSNVLPIIVITKIDLISEEELNILKVKMAYYESYYDIHYVSSKSLENVEVIKTLFKDKISVFAGQTGAGKSSLLNAIDSKLNIKTGEISKALGRGRHTTRHTELIELFGGYVADTPGFSKLDFEGYKEMDVVNNYADFYKMSEHCKYRGCTHTREPKCEVIKQFEEGKILKSRYNTYKFILEEVRTQKQKY